MTPSVERDPSSHANIQAITTKHLHMDWVIDFERKILKGHVVLDMVLSEAGVNEVVLDGRHLNILHISEGETPLKYEVKHCSEALGDAIYIQLPRKDLPAGHAFKLTISYETTEKCSAIQWLTPNQTVGKKHPYLFTQCQAIHARSLVPCQDSPAIKITYSAKVSCPAPLVALMSALKTSESTGAESTMNVYEFEQKTTMPSYLIAMAVGALVGKDVGPRTTVWCEAEMLDACAYEFQDTEDFIKHGEALLTPYEWGRYDLLVLPSSFPYGGMENPCLTFATPTLIAGDRSLCNVIAHEITHSWMGNLVTTANWQHFWLNEGFTVFVERKILGRMYGEKTRQFESIGGLNALQESVDFFGSDNPLTALCPKLEGIDPDDAFSSVPYEKGYTFLYYLEELVGGAAIFEPYLKAHVEKFAGKSITTAQWKAHFLEYFQDKVAPETLGKIMWGEWFDKPGMPTYIPTYDPELANVCAELCESWTRLKNSKDIEKMGNVEKFHKFSPGQKVLFLEKFGEQSITLKHDILDAMDEQYKLTSVRNSEIRFRWHTLCLKSGYTKIFPHTAAFLVEQGRMKFVRPLYRDLNSCPGGGRELAQKTYTENKTFYHPIAGQLIEKDCKF